MKIYQTKVSLYDIPYKGFIVDAKMIIKKRDHGISWVQDGEVSVFKYVNDDSPETVEVTASLSGPEFDDIFGYMGSLANDKSYSELIWDVEEYCS